MVDESSLKSLEESKHIYVPAMKAALEATEEWYTKLVKLKEDEKAEKEKKQTN